MKGILQILLFFLIIGYISCADVPTVVISAGPSRDLAEEIYNGMEIDMYDSIYVDLYSEDIQPCIWLQYEPLKTKRNQNIRADYSTLLSSDGLLLTMIPYRIWETGRVLNVTGIVKTSEYSAEYIDTVQLNIVNKSSE